MFIKSGEHEVGVVPKAHRSFKVPVRVERIRGMYTRTLITPIHDATSVPEGPSCGRGGVAEARGLGFEEVEFVGWVLVDCAAEEGEKYEEDCSSD